MESLFGRLFTEPIIISQTSFCPLCRCGFVGRFEQVGNPVLLWEILEDEVAILFKFDALCICEQMLSVNSAFPVYAITASLPTLSVIQPFSGTSWSFGEVNPCHPVGPGSPSSWRRIGSASSRRCLTVMSSRNFSQR